MRKISGRVVSTKPISLSRAAKLVSRFAAVDNGSSAAVSLYLHRTAEAFNQLVQFHDKRSKMRNMDQESVGNLQIDGVEEGKKSEKKSKKSGSKNVDNETKPDGDEVKDSEIPAKERKRKRKSDEGGLESEENSEIPSKERKKKKKKKTKSDENGLELEVDPEIPAEERKRKKKKNDEGGLELVENLETPAKERKRKKKKRDEGGLELEEKSKSRNS